MKSIIAILLILLLIQSISFAEDCFPGKVVSYSPLNHYSIVWQEPTDGETHHLIFNNGKERKIFFEYGRSVCILWEPEERYFSLTYNLGSNISEAYIYKPTGPEKVIDIIHIMPKRVKELYAKNHHSYIEVLSWTKSGLLIRVWGYGDYSPDGFDVKVKCQQVNSEFNCIEEKS